MIVILFGVDFGVSNSVSWWRFYRYVARQVTFFYKLGEIAVVARAMVGSGYLNNHALGMGFFLCG